MQKTFLRLAAAVALAIGLIVPAHGQATRTWVSGVGDDVNPCSRTAPCKTFAGAISKTAAGGEINCLDPGGFGAVTITKSITIDCTGTLGSILNSGGINGVVVNDSLSATPGTANVILRGLTINGAGTTAGLNGVRFVSGRSLVLQDVFIQNQRGANGISIQPSGVMSLFLENVTVTNGAGGILLAPAVSGSVNAVLRDVRVYNNTGNGVRIDTTAPSSAGVTLTADFSAFSGNNNGFSINTPGPGGPAKLMLVNSTINSNPGAGIIASGSGALVRVGNTTIHGNGFGVQSSLSAVINSYGTNRVDGNITDVVGGFTVIPQE